MSFDVPKLVRSPGCDHRHDEESRNGREVKIDILEGSIRTPEVFRVISEKIGVPGGYRNPPGNLMGLSGPRWKRGEEARAGPRPLPPSPNRTRRGGRRPPSFLPSTSSPLPLLVQHGKGGVLLPVGVGLLLGAPLLLGRRPPPCTFIYGGRGHL